jgi:hypothetical protein
MTTRAKLLWLVVLAMGIAGAWLCSQVRVYGQASQHVPAQPLYAESFGELHTAITNIPAEKLAPFQSQMDYGAPPIPKARTIYRAVTIPKQAAVQKAAAIPPRYTTNVMTWRIGSYSNVWWNIEGRTPQGWSVVASNATGETILTNPSANLFRLKGRFQP